MAAKQRTDKRSYCNFRENGTF